MDSKEFELIIFGATSFVGKILCNYLVQEHHETGLKWAIASRSEAKLQALRESLGEEGRELPSFVADSFDEAALRQLCERTDVVISTVGPYALYGETLVRLCAETGTDYCDLTGEAQWIRRMIERYQGRAQDSGARLVHCCGFDSIPSDLGVKYLQQQALQHFGEFCQRVKMRVKTSKGGASGGTIASGVNVYKEAARDAELREELKDLYSLCPVQWQARTEQRTIGVEYDEDFHAWTAPFIMAAINTRIVLRSNALHSPPYSEAFAYDEATLCGDGEAGHKRARRIARVTTLAGWMLAIPPLRWILLRFLPKPGEGPTPQQQREGHYDLRFHGQTASGDRITVRVTGDRDPGYGSTAKMLAQAGISLSREVPHSDLQGGFWTPATAFGQELFARLQDHAGLTFEVQAVDLNKVPVMEEAELADA